MHYLKRIIVGIVLSALSLYFFTLAMPEITYSGGWLLFLIAGVLIGLLNNLLKPILKIVTLPFIIFTGGLFLIVINAGILWFTEYFLSVAQFRDMMISFPNTSSYVIGAIVLGIINWGIHLIIKND